MTLVNDPQDLAYPRGSAAPDAVAPVAPETPGIPGQALLEITSAEPKVRRPLPPLLWLALVLAATALTYGSSVGHYFFLDDFGTWPKPIRTQTKDLWRPWVYSGDDYRSYWFSNSRVHGLSEPGFFRPLVTMVYAAGLHLWGASAGPFHAINVLAHLATTALLFWLAWRLFASGRAAALTAAIYGLHPCQYEAVEWIAANADALMAMFALLSIAAFFEAMRSRRTGGGRGVYALSLAAFVLALGAKEMAVTIPALLLGLDLWDWIDRGGTWAAVQTDLKNRRGPTLTGIRTRVLWHLPFWLVLAGYLIWRIPAAQGLMALKVGSNYAVSMTSPLLAPNLILNYAFYVLHFFVLYPIFPVNFSEMLGQNCWWLAGLAIVGLGLFGVWLPHLAGGAASRCRIGLGWVAVTLMPFCFLTPGQRLVHFPSAGFALAMGAVAVGVAARLAHRPRMLAWARGVVLTLLGLYMLASFSYVATLGYVTRLVHQSEQGLEQHLAAAPPGTEVYLINLWQPAWMFERIIEIDFPHSNFNVQVLSFNPVILPDDMRQHTNPDGHLVHLLLSRSTQPRSDPGGLARSGGIDAHHRGPRLPQRHRGGRLAGRQRRPRVGPCDPGWAI